MIYTINICHYDYFAGASSYEYKSYTNLLDFWKEYTRIRESDYDYGDSFRSTDYFAIPDDTVVLKPQRPHARTKYEWEELLRASEIEDKIVSEPVLEIDFDDEPIII